MNADGKSDGFVLPTKRANKVAAATAESVEERRSPKGSGVTLVSIPDTAPDYVPLCK